MMSSYVFIILTTLQYMMAGINLDVQLYDKVCMFLIEVWQAQRARSKTQSSRKIRKPRRISFPRFSTPSVPFCTIPKTENSELKTSEFSLRHYDQTRRFSTSEFSTLKTENSGLKTFEFSLRFTRTTIF